MRVSNEYQMVTTSPRVVRPKAVDTVFRMMSNRCLVAILQGVWWSFIEGRPMFLSVWCNELLTCLEGG